MDIDQVVRVVLLISGYCASADAGLLATEDSGGSAPYASTQRDESENRFPDETESWRSAFWSGATSVPERPADIFPIGKGRTFRSNVTRGSVTDLRRTIPVQRGVLGTGTTIKLARDSYEAKAIRDEYLEVRQRIKVGSEGQWLRWLDDPENGAKLVHYFNPDRRGGAGVEANSVIWDESGSVEEVTLEIGRNWSLKAVDTPVYRSWYPRLFKLEDRSPAAQIQDVRKLYTVAHEELGHVRQRFMNSRYSDSVKERERLAKRGIGLHRELLQEFLASIGKKRLPTSQIEAFGAFKALDPENLANQRRLLELGAEVECSADERAYEVVVSFYPNLAEPRSER